MGRTVNILRRSRRAVRDSDLLKILQSEINHEVSSNRFQNEESGSIGDFSLDWDSPNTQDVVLRKKLDSGEEIAVSGLLSEVINLNHNDEDWLPREALVKVCIKKPSLNSILQFDCGVVARSPNMSDFNIKNAYYLPSRTSLDPSIYRGPSFRCTLDPFLQDELKQYLISRGIKESFTNFLILHLHKKEQDQYVNWLHKLSAILAPANDLNS